VRSKLIANKPNLKLVATTDSEKPRTTLGNSRKPISGLTAKGLRGIFTLHLADSFSTPAARIFKTALRFSAGSTK
jgi:hypothetical protein